MQLGLFDIMQIDPLDPANHVEVYRRRLDHLEYADDLGFDIAFVAERHYQQFFRTPAPSLWIAAASQRTKRMRLGVLAYTLPLHSPARLAEEVAVLDQLSGGRLEVGVGLGHSAEELVANAIDPKERVPIFQERMAVMEALWSGGQVTLDRPHTKVHQLAINPLPLQSPFPPLWYAGADQSAATWAGNHGMSLAVGFAPVPALVPATRAFRNGRQHRTKSEEEQDARLGEGRISLMRHVYVSDSDERAHAEMRDDLERIAELNPHGRKRSPDERKESAGSELNRLLENGMFLAGGPETVASGIQNARQMLGIDLFLANVHAAGIDDDRVKRTMRLLNSDVRAIVAGAPPIAITE